MSSTDTWPRVKEIFEAALELAPPKRAAFLDRACADEPRLRARVDSLLAADDRTDSRLDTPAADLAHELLSQPSESPEIGRRIGPHRLLREIGRGGMGTIYLAVRDDGQYREEVAIKLIRRGMDSDAILGRFRRERQILANLDHPNIARLLDGGVTHSGRPYFVMEHIEGEPIDSYCDARGLSIRQRVELFRHVCRAVQAAHRSLVVHCDLKPSNILVTPEGVPKLLDFGIARLLDSEPGLDNATLTASGRPMTPEYASPEQARGEALTTASDVYSLGMVLYKLLTGRAPYRFASRSPAELERAISEQTPERPSAVVFRDGTRDAAKERLARHLSGDLDNIVLMALRKDPARRYSSAEQLGDDLRRHVEGLPVIARQPTLPYRAGKFLRRHWIGVGATALVLLSLVAGIVATTHQARVARTRGLTAERSLGFLVDLFQTADPEEVGGGNLELQDVLELGAQKIDDELQEEPAVRATLLDTIGEVYRKLGQYEQAEPLLVEALALRRDIDAEPEALASSLEHLGLLRKRQARFAEAEELLRPALELRERHLGEAHRATIDSLIHLALLTKERGRFGEAEALYQRALDLEREHFGQRSLEASSILNNLAVVRRRRGNLEGAEPLFREALAMRRQLLGEAHPRVAYSLNNLALVRRLRGDAEEAEKLYREALEMQRELLGHRHHHVAATLYNLGLLLQGKGDIATAERLLREALEIQLEALGEGHSQAATTQLQLATLLYQRRELSAAEGLMRKALNTQRQRLRAGHPQLAITLRSLAMVLFEQGRSESAEPLLREAVGLQRQGLGADHPELAASLARLGEVLTARGELAEAEELLRRSLEIRHAKLDRVQVARSQMLLGACLTARREYAEAEQLLLAAHAVFFEEEGAKATRTRDAQAHLAVLEATRGETGSGKDDR